MIAQYTNQCFSRNVELLVKIFIVKMNKKSYVTDIIKKKNMHIH